MIKYILLGSIVTVLAIESCASNDDYCCNINDLCLSVHGQAYSCSTQKCGKCAPVDPLQLTVANWKDAIVDEPYEVELNASGGIAPLHWALTKLNDSENKLGWLVLVRDENDNNNAWIKNDIINGQPQLPGVYTTTNDNLQIRVTIMDSSRHGVDMSRIDNTGVAYEHSFAINYYTKDIPVIASIDGDGTSSPVVDYQGKTSGVQSKQLANHRFQQSWVVSGDYLNNITDIELRQVGGDKVFNSADGLIFQKGDTNMKGKILLPATLFVGAFTLVADSIGGQAFAQVFVLQGEKGDNGTSVTSTPEPAGTNCTYGGVKYTSANGTNYVCNGAPGPKGDNGSQGPQGVVGTCFVVKVSCNGNCNDASLPLPSLCSSHYSNTKPISISCNDVSSAGSGSQSYCNGGSSGPLCIGSWDLLGTVGMYCNNAGNTYNAIVTCCE